MQVLVVVDMQNDFIDGSLGTKEAIEIVDNVKNKINEYRAKGGVVIFTKDTHTEEYLETQEGQNLPVPHCIKGTFGWEISSKLLVEKSLVIEKPGFGCKNLPEILINEINKCEPNGTEFVDHIELVGLCTDICVITNALILKTAFPEVLIKVDSATCAGVTVESHENALNAMKMCQIQVC